MELLVIGSGAAYPDRPGTASSSYLIEHAGARLLLDLGQGAFAGLAGRVDPASLLAAWISHLHPDHFVDLVALRHYLRYELDPPGRMRVLAPTGLADRLDGLLGHVGFTAESLDVETLNDGSLAVGPFSLETRRVTHADASYAARVSPATEPGATGLVYSGDCGRADDLAPLIRPGDDLLVEVSFGAGPLPVEGLHLDGWAIGRLAAATRAGRVLLTHLQMRRDPAAALTAVRDAYGGPVELVRDGDRFTIAGA